MHETLFALFLGTIVCVFSIWWVNAAHKRKQERLHREIRDNACAERDKQLQEAKDKGGFDIWNHNS